MQNGGTFHLCIARTATVGCLKQAISAQRLPVGKIRLVYRSKQLADDQSVLGDYLLSSESSMLIHLLEGRVRRTTVRVSVLGDQEMVLDMHEEDTIGRLKDVLHEQGIPRSKQRLILKGRHLDEQQDIKTLRLAETDKVYLVVARDRM